MEIKDQRKVQWFQSAKGGYMEIADQHEAPGVTSLKSKRQKSQERNEPEEALHKEATHFVKKVERITWKAKASQGRTSRGSRGYNEGQGCT